jgi:hypothetical protein
VAAAWSRTRTSWSGCGCSTQADPDSAKIIAILRPVDAQLPQLTARAGVDGDTLVL